MQVYATLTLLFHQWSGYNFVSISLDEQRVQNTVYCSSQYTYYLFGIEIGVYAYSHIVVPVFCLTDFFQYLELQLVLSQRLCQRTPLNFDGIHQTILMALFLSTK